MTVDELIAQLRCEWDQIENSYCAAYEALGRAVYRNRTSPDYPTLRAYEITEIDSRRNRQHEISNLIEQIERTRDAMLKEQTA